MAATRFPHATCSSSLRCWPCSARGEVCVPLSPRGSVTVAEVTLSTFGGDNPSAWSSWDVCSLNPATMLRGSPGHTERLHLDLPANSPRSLLTVSISHQTWDCRRLCDNSSPNHSNSTRNPSENHLPESSQQPEPWGGKKEDFFLSLWNLRVTDYASRVTETHSFPSSSLVLLLTKPSLSLETRCDLLDVFPIVPAGDRLGHLPALHGHFQTIFHPAGLHKCLCILPQSITKNIQSMWLQQALVL